MSQGDKGEGDDSGDSEPPIGFDRREVLRRRTGPGPAGVSGDSTGSRERSAISQGFVSSGDASRAFIQGSWSKICGPRSVRK